MELEKGKRQYIALPKGRHHFAPMFIVEAHCAWDIRVRKSWEVAGWLGFNSGAMDKLLLAELDLQRRVSLASQQLCSWMLGEHSIAERVEFLPFEAAIL